jgi:sugar phosphate isomerase/epimerase
MTARFSISQITTLPASFAEDLEAYRDAGAEGIGIWELKIPDREEAPALAALWASGLAPTNAVPNVPSVLPLPLLPGPDDPAARVDAYCASLRRLAPFRPSAVVLLTGPGERPTVVDGLRTIAAEARRVGLKVGLEPYSASHGGEDWTIVNTIGEAVGLIDEAGVGNEIGIMFDLWHLWNAEGLERDLAEHIGRIVGVHVCDVREPTRSFADRLLPGDGVADVPRVLRLLDDAGWDGFYDLEVFSDDGSMGTPLPDSLWHVPAPELARRGRQAFLSCWERAEALAQ